jgi:hypothetical protein
MIESHKKVKHQVQANNSALTKQVMEYHINIMVHETAECSAHTATECVLCEVHMKATESFQNPKYSLFYVRWVLKLWNSHVANHAY